MSCAKQMYRQLCSLHLVQRTVNDGVRYSAASDAAGSLKGGGAEFIRGESPSHKLSGPKYVIVAPDPCEDPEKVYVNVVIRKTQDRRQLTQEWEKMFSDLKKLGPWISGTRNTSPDDFTLDEKHRRAAMDKLTFIGRLDPAAVDLPAWQESNGEFARRLTLRNLCTIILESGIIKSKKDLFNEIFEEPWEVAKAGNVWGIGNRGRFTQESLVEWFFSFDTYSKCIIFYEAVTRYSDAQATPVNLFLDDIYCDVFSQILRQTYITKVDSTVSPEKLLSPTSDTKLLPVTECVKNFITSAIQVTDFSCTRREYRFATGAFGAGRSAVPPSAETRMESVRRILKRNNNEDVPSSDEEYDNYDDGNITIGVRRKAASYRGCFNSERQKKGDANIIPYSLVDGYNTGRISPLTVYMRNEPLVPSAHNHLLFPVFADNKPGAEIVFFMRPKLYSAASLLLPGLFRNKKQYLCGYCKWINAEERMPALSVEEDEQRQEMWKYALADYCPLRYCTEEISPRPKKSGGGTTTSNLTHLDVQPLYF